MSPVGDSPSDTIPWVVIGTDSATIVKALVSGTTPAVYGTLVLQNVSVQGDGPRDMGVPGKVRRPKTAQAERV